MGEGGEGGTLKEFPNNSPVFDLHEVAHQAVASTALDEVLLCRQELLTVGGAKLVHEVVHQRQLALLLDLVQGHGIQHGLNHAAVVGGHHDLVGSDPQGDVLQCPDRLKTLHLLMHPFL